MVKVVVIGGGLSGLSAADYLVQSMREVEVTVLEAQERVGGRTYSVEVNNAWFDLGGMWVGPHQKHVLALAKRAGEKTFKQPFTELVQLHFTLKKVNKLAKTVPKENPNLCPLAVQYDSESVYSWIQKNSSYPRVHKLFELTIRGVFGVEPCELSFLHFLWYTHQSESVENLVKVKDCNQDAKFVNGSQSLSNFLKREIEKNGQNKVILGTFVMSVEQTDNQVIVTTNNGQNYTADYAIIAMPPAIVNKISFTPRLSSERELICQKNFMGDIIKIMILYETQFWKEEGFSGEMLSDCSDSPVFNVFDDSRPNSNNEIQPALVVFLNGAICREWRDKDFKSAVIKKLVQWVGRKAENYQKIIFQDWKDTPVRGAPIAVFGPGSLIQITDIMKPEGRIHWGGTELATEGQGFMDGAVQSGIRAAKEVQLRIEGKPVKSNAKKLQYQDYMLVEKQNNSYWLILIILLLAALVKFLY